MDTELSSVTNPKGRLSQSSRNCRNRAEKHRLSKIERSIDLRLAYDVQPYLNSYEDPDSSPTHLQPDKPVTHKMNITAFEDEMCVVLSSEKEHGGEFWPHFISTFQPHSLQASPKGLTDTWCQLLRSRRVHVESDQEFS